MQSITITSRPPSRITMWNQLSQFRWTSTKIIPTEETLTGYISTMSQDFKRSSNRRTKNPAYLFMQLIKLFKVATRSKSPDMTTVFHAWPYGRFIEIQCSLRRKKLHWMNQGSNFLWGTFSNRDSTRASIQFRKESKRKHLKRWFFLKNRPSIFTSLAQVLLDQSNETSWVFLVLKSTSHFLPQSTVSGRSESSLKANSSCCHRAEAWSHFE